MAMGLALQTAHKPAKGEVTTVNAEVAEFLNGAWDVANDQKEFPKNEEFPNGYEGFEGRVDLPESGDDKMSAEQFMVHARQWGKDHEPKLTVSKVGRRGYAKNVVLFDFAPYTENANGQGRPTDKELAEKYNYDSVEKYRKARDAAKAKGWKNFGEWVKAGKPNTQKPGTTPESQ